MTYPRRFPQGGRQLALLREGMDTERDIWIVPLSGEGETLRAGEYDFTKALLI
jgi:hypothetical protein